MFIPTLMGITIWADGNLSTLIFYFSENPKLTRAPSERTLRRVFLSVDWDEQRESWQRVKSSWVTDSISKNREEYSMVDLDTNSVVNIKGRTVEENPIMRKPIVHNLDQGDTT